ncbi:MAG: T6SS effector amidase Tae4 family protein [Edaphocola sp.]
MSNIIDFWRNEWTSAANTDELFDSPEPQSGGDPSLNYNTILGNWPKNEDGDDDKPATEVFSSLFGSKYNPSTQLLDLGNGQTVLLNNACATRASIAFLLSGISIPQKYWDFVASQGEIKNKGFITTAAKFLTYAKTPSALGMPNKEIKQPSTLSEIQKVIGGKTGLYLMLPDSASAFGASGHVGLWTGYGVLGGHDYASSAKVVYFWELK